jgi:glycosyltransferase involved in cell wall biosynthesis
MNNNDQSNYRPEFSIIMANHNKADYIREALKSVIGQTFKNWELVLIDDFSTDNSIEVIKSFLPDKRVRFLKNKSNLGYIKTLKRAIKESKAEIFGVLDSDDQLQSHALEEIINLHIENRDCGLIYSQFSYHDENMQFKEVGYCREIPKNKSDLLCDSISHFKTFKKKYYLKTSGYDKNIIYAEDKDIAFKMEEVSKILFIDKILYNYRVLPKSQGNDPERSNIRYLSFLNSKINAYFRRIDSAIPNLTNGEAIKILDEMSEIYKIDKNYLKFFISKLKTVKIKLFLKGKKI